MVQLANSLLSKVGWLDPWAFWGPIRGQSRSVGSQTVYGSFDLQLEACFPTTA